MGVCGLSGVKHSPIQDILTWLLLFHQTSVIQMSKVRKYSGSWKSGGSGGPGGSEGPGGPGGPIGKFKIF